MRGHGDVCVSGVRGCGGTGYEVSFEVTYLSILERIHGWEAAARFGGGLPTFCGGPAAFSGGPGETFHGLEQFYVSP